LQLQTVPAKYDFVMGFALALHRRNRLNGIRRGVVRIRGVGGLSTFGLSRIGWVLIAVTRLIGAIRGRRAFI
jgi:hypothetical protein